MPCPHEQGLGMGGGSRAGTCRADVSTPHACLSLHKSSSQRLGALPGDSCGVAIGLCRQGAGGSSAVATAGSCGITGHDRQSVPPGLGRLAWPVTATSELDDIFAGAIIYSVLDVDLAFCIVNAFSFQ
ncbi:MAG: hypothetical protein ABIV42_02305 [Nitrosospira sp.]